MRSGRRPVSDMPGGPRGEARTCTQTSCGHANLPLSWESRGSAVPEGDTVWLLGNRPCWASFLRYLLSGSRDKAKFSVCRRESFWIQKSRNLLRPHLDQGTNKRNPSTLFECVSPYWTGGSRIGPSNCGHWPPSILGKSSYSKDVPTLFWDAGLPSQASSSSQASVNCACSSFHLTSFSFTGDFCLQSICSDPTASGYCSLVGWKASGIPTKRVHFCRIQNLEGSQAHLGSPVSTELPREPDQPWGRSP